MASTALNARQADRRTANSIGGPVVTSSTAARDPSSGDPASASKKPSNAGGTGPADKPQTRNQRPRRKDNFRPMNLLPILFVGLAYFVLKAFGNGNNTRPKFNWKETQYVYAFGDSYTFVQGTAGLANFSFIGDAFNLSFTPEDLLSNEIVPNKTSSDGSNWIEFLTGCLEGRPSDCSPHQLWDFAFAGADIDPTILPLHHNFSVDLVDQVNQWATYAAKVVPHPADKTLTAWWIGINDTGDSFSNSSITDWTLFWHSEMRSYFNAVETAYKNGLRGTYLFINVPPGQHEPARNGDPAAQALLQKRVTEFNHILSGYVQGFARRFRSVNVLSFDAYAWFEDVLANAAQYGFTNTTGDPSYFWYDDGHITQRVHKLLADAIEARLLAASS
ncbi:hypothetical protein EIP86_009630 [Pleurotus ostreatoroseus]|nr:hypothetical protein EIP86_009630 [Pleurotus ostreatoroseus]